MDLKSIKADLTEYCEMPSYLLFQLVYVQRSLGDNMLYVRSTHLEDIFPWWCCHLNNYEISLSSMIAILLATCSHSSDATIQISHYERQKYFYLTQSSMAEFSYLTPVSVSPLKPPLWVIHWTPEYLLYNWLVYKTSSYTVIC